MTTAEILSRLPSLRILVIGDIMVDHYIWGEVNRISPEAPVPVVHVNKETDTAGGAANVALNLASLGVHAELIGCLGDDAPGRRLRDRLSAASIIMDRSAIVNVPTIVKTRVIARTQQICRIDYESARKDYCMHQNPDWMNGIMTAVAEADAVIVSDYAKGVVTQELVDAIIVLARQHDTFIAIDPKPARRLNLSGVGLMTPNRSEALELAGIVDLPHGQSYPLDMVAQCIHERFAPDLLVITLGADGMAVCRGGVVEHKMPTAAREVFDVSGAGDTSIAALTAALASGATAVSAASFANRAAGIVVAKIGTASVTIKEMLD